MQNVKDLYIRPDMCGVESRGACVLYYPVQKLAFFGLCRRESIRLTQQTGFP